MRFLVVGLLVAATATASLRFLRIAQREHYIPGSVTRFGLRWWKATPLGVFEAAVAVAAAGASAWWEPFAIVTAAAVAAGPPGLGLKGRSSPLAWTARLRRVAVGVGVLVVVAAVLGVLVGAWIAAVAAVALPLLVDASLAALRPVEERFGRRWVDAAAEALAGTDVTVVAITGSFGKTSTKGHVARLVGAVRPTLASPASFNNRMGLARAVNEHLGGGIEVFVAEMGTYGRGEIADLCGWIPPDVAVMTAIGPVHLERFGSEDVIVEAKREILAHAPVAVLNVDDARLAAVADEEDAHRRVIRAGTSGTEDVSVVGGVVLVAGEEVGRAPEGVHPTNVACAMGVVVALGIDPHAVSDRLGDLAEPEHRRTVVTGTTGALIVDDTFNSNPAGAAAALDTLGSLEVTGRRIVVTPGMVELGGRQAEENRRFARAAVAAADHLVVVGLTNRTALLEGAGDAEVTVVDSREEAVMWVRNSLGVGDAVLYENDLPDHYP